MPDNHNTLQRTRGFVTHDEYGYVVTFFSRYGSTPREQTDLWRSIRFATRYQAAVWIEVLNSLPLYCAPLPKAHTRRLVIHATTCSNCERPLHHHGSLAVRSWKGWSVLSRGANLAPREVDGLGVLCQLCVDTYEWRGRSVARGQVLPGAGFSRS